MSWKNWRGKEATDAALAASVRAVNKTLYVVLTAARQECPLDEGTLQRSGIVIMDPTGAPSGVVSFGGGEGTGHPRLPYARRWHEKSARFQHGRKRFYLRDPLNRLGSKTLKRAMASEIRKALR